MIMQKKKNPKIAEEKNTKLIFQKKKIPLKQKFQTKTKKKKIPRRIEEDTRCIEEK